MVAQVGHGMGHQGLDSIKEEPSRGLTARTRKKVGSYVRDRQRAVSETRSKDWREQ